jgi:perosamine synthetase
VPIALEHKLIPVACPNINERDGELAREAALGAWGPDHYRFNATFEEMLARYVSVEHAVSLPHATSGLHLALVAAGIGPGDEVIAPDVTWIASVAPIVQVGATPVFVDILQDTWCIDPRGVAAAIGPRTRAIIGVDLYGSVCDWPQLRAIADKHGLLLIEDAAEALGSAVGNKRAGAFGDVSVFSFHGSKTVSTGEGGALLTSDPTLHSRVMRLRDHGRSPGDSSFLNDEIAFKYKMSAVTAAVGIAQMERVDHLVSNKRAIFALYKDHLAELDGLTLNAEPVGTTNSFWMSTAVFDPALGIDKFMLKSEFFARGIETRPFFSPLSTLGAFSKPDACRLVLPSRPVGEAISRSGINLPSGAGIGEEEVERVALALRSVLGSA